MMLEVSIIAIFFILMDYSIYIYCKTLRFGCYFYFTLLAVNTKIAKI